jgi:hypothetical protein
LVVGALEETEETGRVFLELVVSVVVNGGDAAHHLGILSLGEEILDLGMLEERVLLLREHLTNVHTQSGDPVGVPSM